MTVPAGEGGSAVPGAVRNESTVLHQGLGDDPGGLRSLRPAVLMFAVAILLAPALTLAGFLMHRDDPPPANNYKLTQTYLTAPAGQK